jgi:hypothetical protein
VIVPLGLWEDARVRRLLVCAVAGLVLAGCGKPSADPDTTPTSPSTRTPETFTVSGFVTAEGSFALACKGVGATADLHAGARVVVRGAGGASLATGSLGDGFADDDQPQRRCIFPFSVRKVPEGSGPFSVQVADRPPVPFDRRQAHQVEVRLG